MAGPRPPLMQGIAQSLHDLGEVAHRLRHALEHHHGMVDVEGYRAWLAAVEQLHAELSGEIANQARRHRAARQAVG